MIQRYGLFGQYDLWDMEPDSDGEYVLFSDHVAEVERLTALLVAEREEVLWNAYHTGHEKDGMWDHCCMSDGEWLARECGFDQADRAYPADAIKAAIPVVAARAVLQDRPTPTEGGEGAE